MGPTARGGRRPPAGPQVDGRKLSSFYKPQTAAYMERILAREGWQATLEHERASAAEFKESHKL